MTTLETLKLARKRLDKPENWIQHRLSDGNGRYCLLGACDYMKGTGNSGLVQARLMEAIRSLYVRPALSVVSFNSHATHKDVIAVLDTAIRMEQTA